MTESEKQGGDEVGNQVEPSRNRLLCSGSSSQQVQHEHQQRKEEESQHDLLDDAAIQHGEEQGYEGEGFLGIGRLYLRYSRCKDVVVADHHQGAAEADQNGVQALFSLEGKTLEQSGFLGKQVSQIGKNQGIDQGYLDDGSKDKECRRCLYAGISHGVDIRHGEIDAAYHTDWQQFQSKMQGFRVNFHDILLGSDCIPASLRWQEKRTAVQSPSL